MKRLIAFAMFLLLVAASPTTASPPRVIAITTSQSWILWGLGSDLSAVTLEAATNVASQRGFRVLSSPTAGIPTLTLSVSTRDETTTYRGDFAWGTAIVTVRAELRHVDGSVWRRSASALALWLIRPLQTSREAALHRAASQAASQVTVEALRELGGVPADEVEGRGRERDRPSLECDTWTLAPDGRRVRGPEPWCSQS